MSANVMEMQSTVLNQEGFARLQDAGCYWELLSKLSEIARLLVDDSQYSKQAAAEDVFEVIITLNDWMPTLPKSLYGGKRSASAE